MVLISTLAQAQQPSADSLTALLPGLPDGPEKIEVLNQLLKLYLNSDLDKSRSYAYQVANLSKKTGNRLRSTEDLGGYRTVHYPEGTGCGGRCLGSGLLARTPIPRSLGYLVLRNRPNDDL